MPLHREGKKRTYMDLEFYACNGLVRLHDHRDGTIKDISSTAMLERAFAVAKEIQRIPPGMPDAHQQKYTLAKMANEFEETAREAADMGDPLDAQTRAFWSRHKEWRTPSFRVEGLPGHQQRPSGLIVPGY